MDHFARTQPQTARAYTPRMSQSLPLQTGRQYSPPQTARTTTRLAARTTPMGYNVTMRGPRAPRDRARTNSGRPMRFMYPAYKVPKIPFPTHDHTLAGQSRVGASGQISGVPMHRTDYIPNRQQTYGSFTSANLHSGGNGMASPGPFKNSPLQNDPFKHAYFRQAQSLKIY